MITTCLILIALMSLPIFLALCVVARHLSAIVTYLQVKPAPWMPAKVRNMLPFGPKWERKRDNPRETYI